MVSRRLMDRFLRLSCGRKGDLQRIFTLAFKVSHLRCSIPVLLLVFGLLR